MMLAAASMPDPIEATRRLEQYFQLYALNIQLAEAGVKVDYPEATPEEVRRRLAERLRIVRQEKWKDHGPSDSRHH